jgi:cytochrome c556
MWADGSDVGAKAKAMSDAATAMQAAAGTGLEPLKAAMGPLGASCGDCHKSFRVPQ